MKTPALTLLLVLFGVFLLACGKEEQTVSTYKFTDDYRAGEALKGSMFQETSFTLLNNSSVPLDANDFVEVDIINEDVKNYIGLALVRDVKRNEALSKNMFTKAE